jgi:hypothetical protein
MLHGPLRGLRRCTASPLDSFIPEPDVRERFEKTIQAPAALVMEAACNVDLQSLPLVRMILRLRELLLRASAPAPRVPQGLLAETRNLGWGVLAETPGRLIVCGAVCQPWLADVVFTPLPPGRFRSYAGAEKVKIAWTLEAVPIGTETTRFGHETRAVATDAEARRRFHRYWRWARFGIVAIRWLLLPAIRREAERRWRAGETACIPPPE